MNILSLALHKAFIYLFKFFTYLETFWINHIDPLLCDQQTQEIKAFAKRIVAENPALTNQIDSVLNKTPGHEQHLPAVKQGLSKIGLKLNAQNLPVPAEQGSCFCRALLWEQRYKRHQYFIKKNLPQHLH